MGKAVVLDGKIIKKKIEKQEEINRKIELGTLIGDERHGKWLC